MKTKLPLLFILVFILAVSVNAQTDPGTDDVTHEWTFDDGTANDYVGEVPGVLEGGATIENGDLLIDAAGEWCSLPGQQIMINTYSEVTIAVWWNTLDTTGLGDINPAWGMIWYFGGSEPASGGGDALGSNGIFLSPARGDDVCRAAISCGDIETPWSAESGVNLGYEFRYGDTAHFVAVTINDTYIAMYLDGALVDTTGLASHNSLSGLKNDFAFIGRGGYMGDDNYWSRIHRVTMYDRVLSDDEILWLYQNPSAVRELSVMDDVKIYASNGNIYIQKASDMLINSVQIYNVTGSLVYRTNEFTEAIRHNLPPSIYIVKLESNKGDFVSKIMIE